MQTLTSLSGTRVGSCPPSSPSTPARPASPPSSSDESATIIARGYREFPQHFPADGWVEHDLGEIWSATLDGDPPGARRPGRDRSRHRARRRRHHQPARDRVLWDRETLGSPRRAIVWQDRRTASLCETLREDGHEPLVVERTGLRLDPYFSATKLAWIRAHEPHIWASVESGRTAVGTVDSYLVARMSRGLHHVTDATNASRTLLYDSSRGRGTSSSARCSASRSSALPEVVAVLRRLAHTDPTAFLGLDLPITGIAGDQQAALVGQAGFSPGAAKCTYGTGSFLLVHTGDQIRRSRQRPAHHRGARPPGRPTRLRPRGRGLRHRRRRAVAARRARHHRRRRPRSRRSRPACPTPAASSSCRR